MEKSVVTMLDLFLGLIDGGQFTPAEEASLGKLLVERFKTREGIKLSILVDTFLQGYECLSYNPQRFIISLSFNHGRKSLIGRAYPPVIPIADKVSPDECL